MAQDNNNDSAGGAAVSNEALTPLPVSQRVFGWHDHASLWFSLGVGLLVMQIGAYLVPAVGTRDAAIAIVLGSCIGAGLLAWTARLGCQSGLASAGLMHATYGSAFARLPVLLNIVQLVGWTTFELVVMREGTQAIGQRVVGPAIGSFWGGVLTTLLWGAVLLALLAGSMVKLVRRFVSRFGLPLVVLSLLWLSWQFATQLQAKGLDAFWARPGDGTMGMFGALDLVIAMPVSWLPLVADYARHGKRSTGGLGGAFGGTWIGTAQMARELFDTPWIKLELIGDDYTLQPDTLNLVDAASQLIREGFKVLPYCTEDLVLCQRLVDVGCQAVMPWAAPIGTGRGPVNPYALQVLRDRLKVPMLVDAGLGLPSHACQVMEWGYDGVLLNTAVALAQDPVAMAGAFADAVQAGRSAHRAGAMAAQEAAQPSTPVLGTPFWHHES